MQHPAALMLLRILLLICIVTVHRCTTLTFQSMFRSEPLPEAVLQQLSATREATRTLHDFESTGDTQVEMQNRHAWAVDICIVSLGASNSEVVHTRGTAISRLIQASPEEWDSHSKPRYHSNRSEAADNLVLFFSISGCSIFRILHNMRNQRAAPQAGPVRAWGGPGACRGPVRPAGAHWCHGGAWGRAGRQSGSCDPRAPQPQPARTGNPAICTAARLTHKRQRKPGVPLPLPHTPTGSRSPASPTRGGQSGNYRDCPSAVYRGLERRTSPIRHTIAALPDSRHMDTKQFMYVYTICICMHTSACLLL